MSWAIIKTGIGSQAEAKSLITSTVTDRPVLRSPQRGEKYSNINSDRRQCPCSVRKRRRS